MHQELPQTVLPGRAIQTVLKRPLANHLRTNDPDFSVVGRIAAGRVKYIVELRSRKSIRISKDAVAAVQSNSIGVNVGFPALWRPNGGRLAARNEPEACQRLPADILQSTDIESVAALLLLAHLCVDKHHLFGFWVDANEICDLAVVIIA